MQVLEHDEDRLIAALAQQELLDGLQDARAALRRVKRLPLTILDGYIEERQYRRKNRLESAIQREQLAGHFFPNLTVCFALGDLEVAPEEIDDGQIAGPLPVGQGSRLQDEPLLRAMGARELEHEARFAHAGLTHERHHLTTAAPGTVHCRADLLGLGVAPDELAQAAH